MRFDIRPATLASVVGLQVARGITANQLTWDAFGFKVAIYGGITNNRASSSKLGETSSSYFTHVTTSSATWYYWVIGLDSKDRQVGTWNPVSPTGGLQATARLTTELELVAGAVTAAKIAVDAIKEVHIDDGVITAAKIAVNAITEVKIAQGAITAAKTAIAGINPSSGAITANTVAANWVYAGQVAAIQISAGTLNAGVVYAGTIAANKITSGTLAAGVVYAGTIAADNITSGTLASNVIYAGTIAANKITSGTLASNVIYAGTIAADKINAGSLASNVIYTGTLSANQINAGTLTASRISAGTISGSGGSIKMFESSLPSFYVYSSTGILDAGWFHHQIDNSHCSVFATGNSTTGLITSDNSSSNVGSSGLFARGLHGVRGRPNNATSSGLVGASNGKAFHAESGATGPFTGAHDVVMAYGSEIEPGDIVVDHSCIYRRDWSDTLFEVKKTTAPNQKGVVGVFTRDLGPLAEYAILYNALNMNPVYDDYGEPVLNALEVLFHSIKHQYWALEINALGEGQMNVCGEGGNLEPGDLIVSSSIPGKGMKQSDDIVRGYTVAKCRETVTFNSPTQVKQVACIYLCG